MTLLRIAYVINSVEGGGAALPVPSIVDVLRKCGAEVRVFALTARDARALPALLAAGIDTCVRPGGESDHVAALRWLDAQVGAWRPTHLWTSLTRATLLGQLVGWRRRVPVISWQHAAYLKPANLRLLRLLRNRSQLWIGDSAMISALTAERLSIPPQRLMTWPIFRADAEAPRGRAWQPGTPIRIGSLGRIHPVKGYDVLIAALARLSPSLPTWEVMIGGEGEQREALAVSISAAGMPNVVLAGYIAEPQQFLAGLHLYVQPSRSEGLCVAAHEAMLAGLPVAASAVGGLTRSVIDDETGRLVPPGDADALAAALTDLLRAPERLAAMGEAARRKVLADYGAASFEAAGRAAVERLKAL